LHAAQYENNCVLLVGGEDAASSLTHTGAPKQAAMWTLWCALLLAAGAALVYRRRRLPVKHRGARCD
jgi:hypothetical protein